MADPVQEPQANYRDLVENAADLIYTHDLDGHFTWINKACEKITGYSREEGLRMTIWDILAPEYQDRVRKAIEVRLTSEMKTFEVEIIGQRRPARLLAEPVLDPAGHRMRA